MQILNELPCLCAGCKILYVNPTDALLFLSHFCVFVLVFHIYSYLYFIYLYLYFTYIHFCISYICTCISHIPICVSHIYVCCSYFTYFYLCINYFCLYFTYFYLDFSFTYLCLTSTNRSSLQFQPAPSPPITSLWETTQQDNGHWTKGVQSTKNMNSPHEVRYDILSNIGLYRMVLHQ